MTTGTKSLLFGVHQFLFHPFTVWLAWIALYRKLPTFWQTLAIIMHDWGYWGCEKMDDAKGENHPYLGARWLIKVYLAVNREKNAIRKLDRVYDLWKFCLLHSRYLAARYHIEPSDLCWADKYCMRFDPAWFYILRARLSGEIHEYRKNALDKVGEMSSDREWYRWIQAKCIKHALHREKASHRAHTS